MTFLGKNFYPLLILTAVLVGILYSAPQFLIWKSLHNLGKPYLVIQLSHHGDEAHGTFSRYHEAYEGHLPPQEMHFDERLPSPFSPLPIPEFIMAAFLFLFNGDNNSAYDVAHFFLPPILFLLFYFLGQTVTQNRLASFFLAMVGVFTPIVNHLPYAFKGWSNFLDVVVKNFYPLVKTPLPDLFLSRTQDTLLTYLFYLPAIAFLIIFWQNPNKKNALLAAFFVAVMFYTYFHYWVFLTIVIGLLFIFSWIRKQRNPNLFRSIFFLCLTLLILTTPYWINFIGYNSSPAAYDVGHRLELVDGRNIFFLKPFSVVFDYIFYIGLATVVFVVFYKSGRDKNIARLYWFFILAMFLIWNVQLVTGYVPQPDHWYRAASPVIFLILLHSIHEITKKFNSRTVVAAVVVLSLLLFAKRIVNIAIFINPPVNFLKEYAFNDRIIGSWNWIGKNLPYEPRIISPSFITSLYLINNTSARAYLPTGVNTTQANNALENRFLDTYKIFDVKSDILEKIFRADPMEICGSVDCSGKDFHEVQNIINGMSDLYSQYYKQGQAGKNRQLFRYISEEKVGELIDRYSVMSKKNWTDINAQYVYYGPWEKQLSQLDLGQEKQLRLIFVNPSVSLYEIKR